MNKSTITKHTFSLLLLTFLLIMATATTDSDDSSTSSAPTYIDLKASVSFTGTQFVIKNQDTFDWRNVKLDLNPGTFSSGYVLNAGRMEAGETYTVGAMQFAKSDGEKFNPFSHKPQKLSISGDTPSGKGYYTGTWD